jgi:DNA mismatch repair protein MutL
MPKIKQLSPHEAQKIAAGEVVERPANIVKELIENSIDAGATRITIYIEDGGKQLIRIVDNGCGMDITDAQKCFDRHATSKITMVDELEKVETFGFRGEALASIASVSRIDLITKEEHNIEGTHVALHANNITSVDTVACATGTDISVHDLFFNVPARKKFLKATQTEWRTIQLLFTAFCFDYPHIHFSLFTEGKQVNNCPVSTDLKTRALQLFEPTTHAHLIETELHDKEITIRGIMSDHQHYRYDRSSIYFFVNKRWVKNQHLSSAFIKGYANVIPQGRYPIAAINITVSMHEVDINIHPRKEEVKFLHPRRVEQALQNAVKTALEKNLSRQLKKDVAFKPAEQKIYPQQMDNFNLFHPRLQFSTPGTPKENQEFVSFDKLRTNGIGSALEKESQNLLNNILDPFVLTTSASSGVNARLPSEASAKDGSKDTNTKTHIPSDFPFAQFDELSANGLDINSTISQSLSESPDEENQSRGLVIGQYNNTYLLVEREDGLFLVDQHAAHERILYELFSQRFDQVATIQLLFPQIITLTAHEIDLIMPHLDILLTNGIILEQCAQDQLTIQSLPVHLKDQSVTDIIKEVVSWIDEYSSLDVHAFKKAINHKLQAQMACKAAVKAGDILTQEKMEQLLSDLEKTNNRFSCPHGRPTGWLLSLVEIEKKFKRRI